MRRPVPGALPPLPVILTFPRWAGYCVPPRSKDSTREELALVSGGPDGNADLADVRCFLLKYEAAWCSGAGMRGCWRVCWREAYVVLPH